MNTNQSSRALGHFIKSHRERLQPSKAGITHSFGRRRTPGLRREEVAYLANVSVTYYTWLEQGRDVNPSQEVLQKIGEALHLDKDEQLHLYALSEMNTWQADEIAEAVDSRSLYAIVEQLKYPSFITNEKSDVLAWNRAAEIVISDFASWPADDRYIMNIMFSDLKYRERMVNWDAFASYSVAVFRGICDRHPDQSEYRDRVDRLCRESAEFKSLWEKHEIRQKKVNRAVFHFAETGNLEFQIHYAAMIDGNPDLHWCIYTPVPGTGTEEKLLKL
ncbi:Transcriptional regulator, contains XRE-family HTH domain [Paenibacillus sophorae]|uniref:Helix-turn-helix transcriptional regulator n=1 Tax=Paenibacillus sophorae TaxID=1333845 RepID=A0A1H8FCL1_9BACL|nr:helix-turn-helix transcriptional regulator [Paenibacillus sophorae]QWU13831.1 helix-turn-helix transcriptional regulator [Paenibacillus sophorae]SEN29285.1 Transcriptional regulator, contains XRE-family HTH domain [Paenibacillus sophorae]